MDREALAGQDWRSIAADMIEANGFRLESDADDAHLAAASFVFDEGILYLPKDAKAKVVSMLRAATLTALLAQEIVK